MLTLAQRQTKYRKAKRERGECGWKGCEVHTGDTYYCPTHAADHASRMKLARQKARIAA